jgi:hypothetical protein
MKLAIDLQSICLGESPSPTAKDISHRELEEVPLFKITFSASLLQA